MIMPNQKNLKLKLIRSTVGTLPKHKLCVKGLGLRRMHHTVIVPDNACNRGMINKVSYLLLVEEI
jgi:large subunit ribosomal protein L30